MLTVFTCLDLHFDSVGHHHENIEDCCISYNEDEEVTKFNSSSIILTLSFFRQVQALDLIHKLIWIFFKSIASFSVASRFGLFTSMIMTAPASTLCLASRS